MTTMPPSIQIRANLQQDYQDVYTPRAVDALSALAAFDADRKAVMRARIERRAARARHQQPIQFLDPQATIARTTLRVEDARAGRFTGSEIPPDLRQTVDPGDGAGGAARCSAGPQHTQRGVRAPVWRRWVDVRR